MNQLEKKFVNALETMVQWTDLRQWNAAKRGYFIAQAQFVSDQVGFGHSPEIDSFLEDCLDSPATIEWCDCIFENFITNRFINEQGVSPIDDYLKRRGRRDPAHIHSFLEALQKSSLSLYEVIAIDRKRNNLTLRDFLDPDRTIIVFHPSASKTSAIWDCIVARIIFIDQKPHLTSSLVLRRDSVRELISGLKIYRRECDKDNRKESNGKLPVLESNEFDDHIFSFYEEICVNTWLIDRVRGILDSPNAASRSIDDPIMCCDVQYALQGKKSEVIARLDEVYGFERVEGTEQWVWLGKRGSSNTTAKQGDHHSNATAGPKLNAADPDVIAFGFVSVTEKSLLLSTHSQIRAREGQRLIENHFGELMGQGTVSIEEFDDAEQSYNDWFEQDDEVPVTPERREFEPEQDLGKTEEYLKTILSTPLPILSGQSPKQAVKSGRGREKVIDLIKKMENAEYRKLVDVGEKPYDAFWIWQELNIDPLEL